MDPSPVAEGPEVNEEPGCVSEPSPQRSKPEAQALDDIDVLDSSQRQRYLDELNPSGLMP
jgi:hypothetical protein